MVSVAEARETAAETRGPAPPALGACVVCGEAAASLCAACRADAYCGRACQAAAWRAGHRGSCAALPAALRGVRLRLPPRGAPAAEASALCRGAAAAAEGSESEEGGERAGVFAHPPGARRDLAAYLAALCRPDGGTLAVDGALFVQLVAAAEGFLGPAGDGPLPFAVGGGGPWLTLERAARPRLGMLPGYFTAADPAAAALLREVPGGAGGAWLAGPDLRSLYLGMTTRGPTRLPLRTWHAALAAGLRRLDARAHPRLALLLDLGDLGFDDFEVLRAPAPAPP